MNQKTLWIILVIAQIIVMYSMTWEIPWVPRRIGTDITLAAISVTFVSVIFLLVVRVKENKGNTFNRYGLIGAFVASVCIAPFLFWNILGFILWWTWFLFFIATLIFSFVYGIIIFKKKR